MPKPETLLSSALSFVAGSVDTIGFIALSGLFTAHVTGNFVLIGAALAGGAGGVLTKLLALPVFIVMVGLTTAALRGRDAATAPARLGCIAVQALLLVIAMGCGLSFGSRLAPDSGAAMLTGLVAVAAMAVQNAAARLAFGTLAPSTVMTGNVTQVVVDAVGWLLTPPARRDPATSARMARFSANVGAFALGCIGGALLVVLANWWALLAPLIALATAAWATMRCPPAGVVAAAAAGAAGAR